MEKRFFNRNSCAPYHFYVHQTSWVFFCFWITLVSLIQQGCTSRSGPGGLGSTLQFDPESVGTVGFWTDSSSSQSYVLNPNDGVTITSIKDRRSSVSISGAPSPCILVLRVQNGKDGFEFGSGGSTEIALPSSYTGASATAIAVASYSDGSGSVGRLLSSANGTDIDYGLTSGIFFGRNPSAAGTLSMAVNRINTYTVVDALPAYDSPLLMSAEISANDMGFGLNGGTFNRSNSGSGENFNINRLFIGWNSGNASFTGRVFEILFYYGALSDSNRQKVEGYLAHKWGLASSLPIDHPYKSSAP